jgi:FkbM family methyltransferase
MAVLAMLLQGVAAQRQEACTPLLTAEQLYPLFLKGRLRTLLATTCNSTYKLYYLSGGGDQWAVSKFGLYACLKQFAWIDGFYASTRARLNPNEWSVLDVGGNLGQEPIIAGMHGYKAYTFEPFQFNVESLRFNAALNCVHDRVHVINMGATDQPGSACFETPPAKNEFSNAGTGVKRGGQGRFCINMSSLDVAIATTFDAARKPLLLKIDCEGNEESTLKGSHQLLSNSPPVVILMEVINRKKRLPGIAATLQRYGYGIYSSWKGDSTMDCNQHCKPMSPRYWENDESGVVEIVAVHLRTVQHKIWHGIFDHAQLERIRKQPAGLVTLE